MKISPHKLTPAKNKNKIPIVDTASLTIGNTYPSKATLTQFENTPKLTPLFGTNSGRINQTIYLI